MKQKCTDQHVSPTFFLETQYAPWVAGVDEVGYGAWAGPVVAAAVIFKAPLAPKLLACIQDSKQVCQKNRFATVHHLLDHQDVVWAIGVASVDEVNALHLLPATWLAMRRAIKNLHTPPRHVLVDGNPIPSGRIHPSAQNIIQGDTKSFSIAAASLFAKVARDQMMSFLEKEFPAFGWHRNKGYGTALHQEALKCYGPTPYHRKNYKPVQEALRLFLNAGL